MSRFIILYLCAMIVGCAVTYTPDLLTGQGCALFSVPERGLTEPYYELTEVKKYYWRPALDDACGTTGTVSEGAVGCYIPELDPLGNETGKASVAYLAFEGECELYHELCHISQGPGHVPMHKERMNNDPCAWCGSQEDYDYIHGLQK